MQLNREPDPTSSQPKSGTAQNQDSGATASPEPSALRANAKKFLSEVRDKSPILSKGKSGEDFFKYTGTSHESMAKNWQEGGIMTACNGFAGKFSSAMGLGYLGRFDLASVAASAFIKPGGDRRPKDGDIFKANGSHMGVFLDCDGGAWGAVEAGQGGKGVGYDILKHSPGRYGPSNLEGWVDIDLWANPEVRAKNTAVSKLELIGWWEVKFGEWRRWHYSFSGNNLVDYVDAKNSRERGGGKWTADDTNVTIAWDTGSTETWPIEKIKKGNGNSTEGKSTFERMKDNPLAQSGPTTAAQLNGAARWKVKIGDWRIWHYSFSGANQVAYADSKDPKGKDNSGTGTWKQEGKKIVITWGAGSIEEWTLPLPGAGKTGQGVRAGGEASTYSRRW